jgi:hypothetical protein
MSEKVHSSENPLDPFNYDLDQDIQDLLTKVCIEPSGSVKASKEVLLSDNKGPSFTFDEIYRKYLFPPGAQHAAFRYELRPAKKNEIGVVQESAGPYIVLRALVPKVGTNDASAFYHAVPLVGLLRSASDATEQHIYLLSYLAGESSLGLGRNDERVS